MLYAEKADHLEMLNSHGTYLTYEVIMLSTDKCLNIEQITKWCPQIFSEMCQAYNQLNYLENSKI